MSDIPRTIAVTDTNPHDCTDGHDCDHHEHGPDCGHEAVQHGDHVDYVVGGHPHHPARLPLRPPRPLVRRYAHLRRHSWARGRFAPDPYPAAIDVRLATRRLALFTAPAVGMLVAAAVVRR